MTHFIAACPPIGGFDSWATLIFGIGIGFEYSLVLFAFKARLDSPTEGDFTAETESFGDTLHETP